MHSVGFYGAECIAFSTSCGARGGLHGRPDAVRRKVCCAKGDIREYGNRIKMGLAGGFPHEADQRTHENAGLAGSIAALATALPTDGRSGRAGAGHLQ
jgi:hypothetical protein